MESVQFMCLFMRFLHIFCGVLWDILRGFAGFHGSVQLLRGFYGISAHILWNFVGFFVGFLLDLLRVFMGSLQFLQGFYGISAGFLWGFVGFLQVFFVGFFAGVSWDLCSF